MVVHMTLPVTPVHVSEIEDLHRRLDATRIARLTGGAGGVDPSWLAELLHTWRNHFDLDAFSARILALPWADAGPLRVLHQPMSEPDAPVVVLLHGWPDSVLRFERVLPLLRDVNVVVPALPGFPFAAEGSQPCADVIAMADAVEQAMDSLGYRTYVVSGGDVGGDVAEHLTHRHAERVPALHLTNVSPLHAVFADRDALGGEELAYLDVIARWSRTEGGYIAEQSTKPQTLAVGLADSPAGLAAWIGEKLQAWAHTPFDDADLLAWISAYWLTNTIGTSFDTYARFVPPVPFVATPTVLSTFAHDTKPAPMSFASRYVDVRSHIEHDRGGHFAAWEQPELYAADVRVSLGLARETEAARDLDAR